LLKPIVKNGKLVYNFPTIEKIREKTKQNISLLPAEYKRLINPHIYSVGISKKLKQLKEKLVQQIVEK